MPVTLKTCRKQISSQRMKLKNDFVAITEYSKRPTKNELGGDGCPTLGL